MALVFGLVMLWTASGKDNIYELTVNPLPPPFFFQQLCSLSGFLEPHWDKRRYSDASSQKDAQLSSSKEKLYIIIFISLKQ